MSLRLGVSLKIGVGDVEVNYPRPKRRGLLLHG